MVTNMSAQNFRIPFGKHKGTFLAQIPTAYLVWLDNTPLRAPLDNYVMEELDRRNKEDAVGNMSHNRIYKCATCSTTILKPLYTSGYKCKVCGANWDTAILYTIGG